MKSGMKLRMIVAILGTMLALGGCCYASEVVVKSTVSHQSQWLMSIGEVR